MSVVETVALVHLLATGFMVGLIWTIHVVHYPLFPLVGEPYRPFQDEHMRRISRLLVVPWGVEVLSAFWLLVAGSAVPLALRLLGIGLVGAVLGVTAFAAAPLHGRLLDRFDADVHRGLMRADAVRVALWSARAVVAFAMVAALADQ